MQHPERGGSTNSPRQVNVLAQLRRLFERIVSPFNRPKIILPESMQFFAIDVERGGRRLSIEYAECSLDNSGMSPSYWTHLFGVDKTSDTVVGLTNGSKFRVSSDPRATAGRLAGLEGTAGLVELRSHVLTDEQTGEPYRRVELLASPAQADVAERLASFLRDNVVGVGLQVRTILSDHHEY